MAFSVEGKVSFKEMILDGQLCKKNDIHNEFQERGSSQPTHSYEFSMHQKWMCLLCVYWDSNKCLVARQFEWSRVFWVG